MAIPDHVLDEIRARFRLADVIGRHVRLTRHGREFQGLCPFHKEKTPSFTVNEQKGFYHCFGCGAHGSLFDFVMKIEGLAFRDAVTKLAAEAGIAVPADSPRAREEEDRRGRLFAVMEAACTIFERKLMEPEGEAAHEYLARRGVNDETVRRFRLGFAAAEGRGGLRAELTRGGYPSALLVEAGLLIQPPETDRSPYERFRGRVMFPIADRRGRIVGFGGRILGAGEPKYLNSPETPLFHKGGLLYGAHFAEPAARRRGRIIGVEGYMDVIGLHGAGFAETVAPLGTALTADQLAAMWRLAPEVILCFDPDAAGQRAAGRVVERALPLLRPGLALKIALLETDTGDDPDQVARRYPPQFLEQTFADAMVLSDFIYWLDSGGRAPRSAEEAAALEQRLGQRSAAIGDIEMRRHFRQAFRERLRRDLRPARPGRHAAVPPAARRVTTEPPPRPAEGAPGRWIEAEKHLLAVVLTHPEAFPRLDEALGTLTFRDAGFERLRQATIAVLSSHDIPATAERRARLATDGCAEALGRVLDDPGVRIAGALGPDGTAEDRDAYAREQLDLLRRRALAEELSTRTDAPSATAEEWAQRQALIRARLDGGGG